MPALARRSAVDDGQASVPALAPRWRTFLIRSDMNTDKNQIKTILFITLSNLGDIILTTPVLEKLHDEFPGARVDVVTGAPGRDIFTAHPAVREVIDAKSCRGALGRMRQVFEFRRRRYDLVVDLKKSLVPYLIGAKFRPRAFVRRMPALHKRDEHLSTLAGLVVDPFSDTRFFIPVMDDEKNYIGKVMAPEEGRKTVVINPGAKSHLKRWDEAKYAALSDRLVSELGCRVFMTGTEDDAEAVSRLIERVKEPVTDLCRKTSIGALAELMRRADLVITNDSAPLHVASAVNAPTVAIFGPSDERKYGPLADRSRVIKPDVPCRPCGRPLCAKGPEEGCISRVTVENVFRAAVDVLVGEG